MLPSSGVGHPQTLSRSYRCVNIPHLCIVHVVVKVEEADHIYLLMKEDYRISRNVRLAWFLSKLNQIICPASKPEVVSYFPVLQQHQDQKVALRLAPFYSYSCICHQWLDGGCTVELKHSGLLMEMWQVKGKILDVCSYGKWFLLC